jgi:hypothetical protein
LTINQAFDWVPLSIGPVKPVRAAWTTRDNGSDMPMEPDRISVLEARAAIAELVHRYARNARMKTFDGCESLFTEDATFEVREAKAGDEAASRLRTRLEGRAAILDYIHQGATSAGVCPVISNMIVEVDHPVARSTCLMSTRIAATGETMTGEYQDSYRYDGGWRFISRVYVIFTS